MRAHTAKALSENMAKFSGFGFAPVKFTGLYQNGSCIARFADILTCTR